MKQLFVRVIDLALVEAVLTVASIEIGLPAKWVIISSLLALDFAAIVWLSQGSSTRGKRRFRPLLVSARCSNSA